MEMLTVQEVARRLKLHDYTIRDYIRKGKLAAVKFGRVWRVSEEDLRAFIESQRKKS